MITIHARERENRVILLKNEFDMLLEHLGKIHKIRIITDDDADCLTEQDMEELRIAEAEFEAGETISFDDVREKWLKGGSIDV
ncbi:MAG: hypothetical protein AB7S75_22145 [Desulfococcaceae bacterium]